MTRPTAVTVFGILNIVFALFGFCGVAFQLAQPAFQASMENFAEKAAADAGQDVQQAPLPNVIQDDPNLKMVGQVATGLEAVASIVLLISGIGLLKMQSWGRTLSILYAIYDILQSIVFSILSVLIMMPLLEAQGEAMEGPGAGALTGIVAGSIGCGLIFSLVYPILLFVFMTRSNVREAFSGAQGDMTQIPDDNPYSDPMS